MGYGGTGQIRWTVQTQKWVCFLDYWITLVGVDISTANCLACE